MPLRALGSIGSRCATPAAFRSKTAAMPRVGPKAAALLSAQWRLRSGWARWARAINPLTMIKRSLPVRFPLICQTDRMPAGGAAWGFFGESQYSEQCMGARSRRGPKHVFMCRPSQG
jgi:hypothetical protein